MSGSERPLTSADLLVAGVVLRVVAAEPTDLGLATRMLGENIGRTPPVATIELRSEAPELPDRPPDLVGAYGDHWDDDGVHSFRHHWGFAAVVTADRAVMGGAARGYERWVTVRNSMLFVIARLLLTRDLFVLHGAAVRRGDRGVLVIGESGSGKSTLAFAAGLRGWKVLGDDMVVVEPASSTLRLRGIPRVPSVPGDIAAVTDVRGEPLPPSDLRERLELVGHEMDHGVASIDALVLCTHSAGQAFVEPVDAVTALHGLIPAFVLADLPAPVRRWFPHASRVANGPSHLFGHDASVDHRLDRAADLLDTLLD